MSNSRVVDNFNCVMIKEIFKEFEPRDFIAMILIIGGFVLVYKGIDMVVGTLLSAVAFYYFGKKEQKKTIE